MAKQHFYSRVPACMSMYKHADGYDTFAQSEGLSEEYAEATVQKLLHIKLTPEEKRRVEEGNYPPVYCIYGGPGGDRLQSRISFLPKDFSGEQSCFFVHTLIFKGEEARMAYSEADGALLDPSLFDVSPGAFAMGDPASRYDSAYPEAVFAPAKVPDEAVNDWYQKYPYNTVRQFLSVLLSRGFTGSSEGPIYVLLPVEDSELSSAALSFMNAVMAPFPDFIKTLVSFATYTEDLNRFKACRIRFLPHTVEGAAATAKGMVFDFSRHIGNILRDEVYRTNASAVEFLYGLYENHELRRRFIGFYQNAMAKDRQYAKYDKSFFDFIDLFKSSCGFFKEDEAFPDDASVQQLLTAYEKYRSLLEMEDRQKILTVVRRYDVAKVAIPKEVFGKISRLYPKEPAPCKEVLMDVVLSLLHTDVMRSKLFLLVKGNLDAELPERRTLILQHLAQVFRGGFLQPQIMEVISACFGEEPADNQIYLLEKLLLTLRTEAVQKDILAFLEKNGATFTDECFSLMIATLIEMLSHEDDLCKKTLALLDSLLESVAEDRRLQILEAVFPPLENTRRPDLIAVAAPARGGLYREAMRRALTQWGNRKIGELFFTAIFSRSPQFTITCISDIRNVCRSAEEIQDSGLTTLCNTLAAATGKQFFRADLFTVLALHTAFCNVISDLPQPRKQKFVKQWEADEFWPAVISKLYQAMDPAHPHGMEETLAALAEAPASVQADPAVAVLRQVSELLAALRERDTAGALARLLRLPMDESFRQPFSARLQSEFSGQLDQWYADPGALGSVFFFEALSDFAVRGTFPLDEVAERVWKRRLAARLSAEEAEQVLEKPTEASSLLALDLMEAMARFCDLLASSSSSEGLRLEVYAGVGSYLSKASAVLQDKMRSKEKKMIPQRLAALSSLDAGVSAAFSSASKNDKPGFFKRLFGKK